MSGKVLYYVVQEVTGGSVYSPMLFSDKKIAEQVFVRLVNEHYEKSFKTYKWAANFYHKQEQLLEEMGGDCFADIKEELVNRYIFEKHFKGARK